MTGESETTYPKIIAPFHRIPITNSATHPPPAAAAMGSKPRIPARTAVGRLNRRLRNSAIAETEPDQLFRETANNGWTEVAGSMAAVNDGKREQRLYIRQLAERELAEMREGPRGGEVELARPEATGTVAAMDVGWRAEKVMEAQVMKKASVKKIGYQDGGDYWAWH